MNRVGIAITEMDEWFMRQNTRGGSMEVHNRPMDHTEFFDIFAEGRMHFQNLKEAYIQSERYEELT